MMVHNSGVLSQLFTDYSYFVNSTVVVLCYSHGLTTGVCIHDRMIMFLGCYLITVHLLIYFAVCHVPYHPFINTAPGVRWRGHFNTYLFAYIMGNPFCVEC